MIKSIWNTDSFAFLTIFPFAQVKSDDMSELDQDIRSNLYLWLDSIPFSRPRKRLARFFADASAVVEIINYFHPNFAQEIAYPSCMNRAAKIDNWERLNKKVLDKLGLHLTKVQIANLADAKLKYTESFLCRLAAAIYQKNYDAIQKVLARRRRPATPETESDSTLDNEYS